MGDTLNDTDLLTGKALIKRIAQEFIENYLDVEITPENIRRFSAHIIVFEYEVERRKKRNSYK